MLCFDSFITVHVEYFKHLNQVSILCEASILSQQMNLFSSWNQNILSDSTQHK